MNGNFSQRLAPGELTLNRETLSFECDDTLLECTPVRGERSATLQMFRVSRGLKWRTFNAF